MEDIDFKEEMRQDMMQEAKQEAYHEYMMRSDWDYALRYQNLSEDSTVKQLIEATESFNTYGWNVNPCDVIEDI